MSTIIELTEPRIQEEKQFWTAYLQEFDVKSILPTDYPVYLSTTPKLDTISFELSCQLSEQIIEFGILRNLSLTTVLYSAWALLLKKYNNSDDVLFGTPDSSGRYLPFRTKSHSKQTISEFLQDIQLGSRLRKSFEDTPLDRIKTYCELDATQVMFDSLISISGEAVKPQHLSICIEINPKKSMEFTITYNTHLFEEATIYRVINHFKRVIQCMIERSELELIDVEILCEQEQNQVLFEFNSLTQEYNRTLTIDQLFEEQVIRNPNQTAIICGEREITYLELDQKANQLAHVLISKGVVPDQLIGLITERDIELIIGMLGIMKAGAAYLPIDPAFPQERINYMFQNGNVKMLLTHSELNIQLEDVEYVYLDKRSLHNEAKTAPDKVHGPEHLMYVLYTSGSTGQPKGVAVEHRNVAGYVHSFNQEFNLSSEDKMIQQSTVSFDISVEEIYPILLNGGTLIIAQRHEVSNIPHLLEVINKHGATMISGFPLLMNELNKYPISETLHTYISGGDVLREEYVSNIIRKARVYNTYGPSETTVCITYYRYQGENQLNIPTGKPIANVKVYILDRHQKPMPIGVPGEVCISGVGVSREYLNRSDITNERYVPNPFNHGEKMFISGDLARWLPDGNVEFMGRIDDQIKIRGRRTEPGEVQRLLLKHKSVSEAFVLARTDKNMHKYLTAYVVGENLISAAELKEHLLKHMPDFMVPSYYVQMEKLPLTPNGKVDKKLLCRVID